MISNSTIPTSDPRLQQFHLRFCCFKPRFNQLQIWFQLCQFQFPHFRPQFHNSDSANFTPSTVNYKIFHAAASWVIYGWSLTIASLWYVVNQHQFYIRKINTHMELVAYWFFVRETCRMLVVCFSPRETDFVHGTCCVWICVDRTCDVQISIYKPFLHLDFSLRETWTLIFSLWNPYSS